MIELPEATVLARQLSEQFAGRTVHSVVRGNTPHKFAFYTGSPEDYERIMIGRLVGKSVAEGFCILLSLEPDYVLVLGMGGEKIVYQADASRLPARHHFLAGFDDGSYLSVTVQGWGAAQLMPRAEIAQHFYLGKNSVMPLSEAYTFEYFNGLFEKLQPGDAKFLKYFLITEQAAYGVGNGCLQDILFHAKLHPRRRAAQLSLDERKALYDSIQQTLQAMVDGGGRDTETDLYGRTGKYSKILDTRAVGKPCPTCGTLIEKISFMGGAAYFCPECQI